MMGSETLKTVRKPTINRHCIGQLSAKIRFACCPKSGITSKSEEAYEFGIRGVSK